MIPAKAALMLYTVSILVLMDAPLIRSYTLLCIAGVICFNPCFNGCPADTLRLAINYAASTAVSILVLMDAPLILDHPYHRVGVDESFNPCFNGCPADTFSIIVIHPELTRFNPCFNGCPADTFDLDFDFIPGSGFQSLF